MRIRIMTPAVLGLLFGLTRLASADLAPPFPPPKGGTRTPLRQSKHSRPPSKLKSMTRPKAPS